MTVNTTPGWYIVERARIGTHHFHQGASSQPCNAILHPDDRHRAEQTAGIDHDRIHKSHCSGMFEVVNGFTVKE